MPGRPRTAALKAHLREEVEGQSRAEIALELWASGQMQEDIAAGVTLVYDGEPWTPNRRTLFDALRADWPEEYAAARAALAETYVEDGLKGLKAANTKDEITKARELASMYRWLAARRDPANFGDAPATAIQINNPGQLFLQAVARPGAAPPPKQLPGDARGVSTAPNDDTKDD